MIISRTMPAGPLRSVEILNTLSLFLSNDAPVQIKYDCKERRLTIESAETFEVHQEDAQ